MTTLTIDAPAPNSLDRVREEYREMPGLNLTKMQICRLWALDAPACDALVTSLVDGGFLKRTASDLYVRADLDAHDVSEPAWP